MTYFMSSRCWGLLRIGHVGVRSRRGLGGTYIIVWEFQYYFKSPSELSETCPEYTPIRVLRVDLISRKARGN
jgi:hypothetical protein